MDSGTISEARPTLIPTVTVYPTTPLAAQEESTAQRKMATFKVFDPTTGQYVEKELDGMTPVADAAKEAVQPVVEAAREAVEPVVEAAKEAVQPVVQAAQPVVQAAQPVVQAVQQGVPTIQVQPQVQKMPVMVLDQATGQYVQQMVDMVLDPATGNYVPAPVATDPKALEAQQKAAAAAAKEAERKAREQEAAERRARNDQLREEAAERARKNDSVAGRVKNTAISTATRQIVSSLVREGTKLIKGLFGGSKK